MKGHDVFFSNNSFFLEFLLSCEIRMEGEMEAEEKTLFFCIFFLAADEAKNA